MRLHLEARLAFALLALLALLPAGCGQQPPAMPPDVGTVRIAALSPAIAVMLHDLGAEDRIVARHGWDLVLDRGVPVAGDQAGLDYEALLRVRPTHVLLEWGARPLPARLEALALQEEWAVRNYRILTLDDVRRTARELHEEFVGTQAWADSALAGRMERALAPREGLEQAGRILLLHSARPPAALGPGSAHHQVLEAIGGTPALVSGSPFITMDLEDVLRLSPDGIILISSEAVRSWPAGAADANQAAARLGRVATLEIPAVKMGRLAVIKHPLAALPSTSLVIVADQMAEILESWVDEEVSGEGQDGG